MGDSASQVLSGEEVEGVNARFERVHPMQIVEWAAGQFGEGGALGRGLAMTSSFGADSMCTIHLATRVMPGIRIIVINTGYLFPETLAFMEEMRGKYKLNIVEYRTKNDPVVWLSVNG